MFSSNSPILCSLLLVAACSVGTDDEEMDIAGDTDGGGTDGGDGPSICAETPSRLVVLGDSIAACFGVNGRDAASCGPKIFSEDMATRYAPGISYENLAVSGSVTTDIVDEQLATIFTGAGHAMVLIYVGGNDIQRYLTQADAAAEAGLSADLPGIKDDWRSIFAFFADTTNFPDGATIIMNNQYNPFDECTAPPFNLSSTKNALLVQFNTELANLADEEEGVYLTDQYTAYLGHGHHYNVQACPHYQAGLQPFMEDLIHPNVAGHAHLAVQWSAMADTLYAGCE